MDSKMPPFHMLKLKCPKCHRGDLFINQGMFAMARFLKMHEKCKRCGQDFRIEPDFYSTSLWIGFPIVLVVFAPLLVFGLYVSEIYEISLSIVLPILLLLYFALQIPIMRISRAILLYLTFNYFEGRKKK